jgi:hypothetical protein
MSLNLLFEVVKLHRLCQLYVDQPLVYIEGNDSTRICGGHVYILCQEKLPVSSTSDVRIIADDNLTWHQVQIHRGLN